MAFLSSRAQAVLRAKNYLFGKTSVRLLQTTSPVAVAEKDIGDEFTGFTHFRVPNEIGYWDHRYMPDDLRDFEFDYPLSRDTMGIRWPGYWIRRKFHFVPEMIPQLVVPDLTGFELKPYVSYRTENIEREKHSAQEIFNACYADDIIVRFRRGEEIQTEISEEEVKQARIAARQTGSDYFEEQPAEGVQKDRLPKLYPK